MKRKDQVRNALLHFLNLSALINFVHVYHPYRL